MYGNTFSYEQIEMTKAAYAAINRDYKGMRVTPDKSFKFRTCMHRGSIAAVFLTDSKAHPMPASGYIQPLEAAGEAVDG